VRLLVNPPQVIIMDEATAALDEESQARMLDLLRTDLAAATVISVAHRPGLEEYFDREIQLVRAEAGHATAQDRPYPRLRNLLQRLMRLPPGPRSAFSTRRSRRMAQIRTKERRPFRSSRFRRRDVWVTP
jgi:putative ATP-binding cassette transporter